MSESQTDTGVFLAEGDEARKKSAEKPKTKTKFIKLKAGESIRGFLMATKFVLYYNHGDYDKGIKSFTCNDPHKAGRPCLGCEHGVKRTKMTVVPFYNVDTREVEIFDANSKHDKTVYAFIDSYGEDATSTPISFGRTGDGTSTVYSIMPIPPKQVDKALFVKPEIVIDDAFYAEILKPADDDYIRGLIGLAPKTAGDATPTSPAPTDGDLPPVTGTQAF